MLLCLRIHDVIPLAANRLFVVCCSHDAVDPCLQIVLWHSVEGGVAVSVLVASLLVGVLWADLGRVFFRFVVWLVWFVVGDVVDIRGVCSFGNFLIFSSSV